MKTRITTSTHEKAQLIELLAGVVRGTITCSRTADDELTLAPAAGVTLWRLPYLRLRAGETMTLSPHLWYPKMVVIDDCPIRRVETDSMNPGYTSIGGGDSVPDPYGVFDSLVEIAANLRNQGETR